MNYLTFPLKSVTTCKYSVLPHLSFTNSNRHLEDPFLKNFTNICTSHHINKIYEFEIYQFLASMNLPLKYKMMALKLMHNIRKMADLFRNFL